MKFIDYLVTVLGVKNDAALARALSLTAPAISKYRSGTTPIGAGLILRAHEVTGIPVRTLKGVAGLKCLDSRA